MYATAQPANRETANQRIPAHSMAFLSTVHHKTTVLLIMPPRAPGSPIRQISLPCAERVQHRTPCDINFPPPSAASPTLQSAPLPNRPSRGRPARAKPRSSATMLLRAHSRPVRRRTACRRASGPSLSRTSRRPPATPSATRRSESFCGAVRTCLRENKGDCNMPWRCGWREVLSAADTNSPSARVGARDSKEPEPDEAGL